MKVFCGTDIIEVKRMEESAENLGPKFLARIFTENEIKYCEQKKDGQISTLCSKVCSQRSDI